ncbi:MAG: class I SAM-dependent methyltransferase [Mycolicibacterium sp.]|uniref:class I SAM-dependent methyltransferase n=1 Tax=Mycolicibacterium sp. TaxID=2320850 RepID=UPI003D10EF93
MEDKELKRRFYPESNVGGFSHVDGTISFFNHLAAIVRQTDTVLDFGAGRGNAFLDDEVDFRREIQNFKGRCRHLDGCDIDPAVLHNPSLDDAKVIVPGEPLPYEDNRFDVIIARWVFEHIDTPEFVASELLRVVKPGGIIAATTPNKWGYIGLGARSVPSRLHVRVLSRSQPTRKAEDVFPTRYKMNTARALFKAFGAGADVFIAKKASEPAYHFGKPWIYRSVKWMNKHCPDVLLPVVDVYVRKQ